MSTNQALIERVNKAVGRRIVAGIIDLVLCAIAFFVAAANFGTTTTTVRSGGTSQQVSLTGWPFLAYCALVLAYFTLMEWQLGATLGKLLMGVRVVDAEGRRIGLGKSLVRNLLRVLDAFPMIFPYVVGLIAVAVTKTKQRVGDKAAGTLVVGR